MVEFSSQVLGTINNKSQRNDRGKCLGWPVTSYGAEQLQSQPGPVSQYRMRVSNTFTVNVIFCPLKANTWRLKNKSCNRNEPKQYTNAWQIIEVSNSTRQHADNSAQKSRKPMTCDGSSFLLITQYEMPFINKSEATKRSNDRNINGKPSVQMGRVEKTDPHSADYPTDYSADYPTDYPHGLPYLK